jgi:hypothetical protein
MARIPADSNEFPQETAENAVYAAHMRYRDEIELSPYVRDEMILKMRQKGHTYRAIAKAVGMAPSAVHAAYRRLAAGGPGTRARWP